MLVPKGGREILFSVAPEVLPTVADLKVSVDENVCAVPSFLPPMSNLGQLDLISELFKSYCTLWSDVSPPDDFLQLSMLTMKHLRLSGRAETNTRFAWIFARLHKYLNTMKVFGYTTK